MRKPFSEARIRDLITNLIAPTLFWISIVKPVLRHVFSPQATINGELLANGQFNPEWYLEALIVWRLLSFVLRLLRPSAALVLVLGVAGLGGYCELGEIGLQRLLGYNMTWEDTLRNGMILQKRTTADLKEKLKHAEGDINETVEFMHEAAKAVEEASHAGIETKAPSSPSASLLLGQAKISRGNPEQ